MKTKGWAIGVAVIVIVAVIGVSLAVASSDYNGRVSPILSISTARDCDFVEFAGTVWAVCDDGTKWTVKEDRVPIPLLADTLRDTEERVTITAESVTQPPVVAVDDVGEVMTIRYSWYNPALGGPNCATFVDGVCVSKMANRERWQDYVGEAVACPPEWAFGTTVTLDGETWTCRDRGGKIKFVDGISWVDFLRTNAAYPYGTLVQAVVRQVR